MKRCVLIVLALLVCPTAFAQEMEPAPMEMEEDGHNMYAPLYLEDANPVPAGQVDFRLRFEWLTDDYADVAGDDDFVLGAGFHVGMVEDWQLSLEVPFNVGDGGDKTDAVRGFDGNGDATVGVMCTLLSLNPARSGSRAGSPMAACALAAAWFG